MLACARLGAPHSVVFGGFSADALAGRILDADARVVITADGGYRRGAASPLKPNVDEALTQCPDVRHGAGRAPHRAGGRHGPRAATSGGTSSSTASRPSTRPRRSTPSNRSTSCTPAAPRPSPRASCTPPAAIWSTAPTTHRLVFDIKPEKDVFWTAADIGWVTGHSYIVYGPLANGTTSVLYEGTPDAGGKDRWWRIVEEYEVTILYTAPTTIRTLMKWGEQYPGRPRSVEPAPARLGRRAHQPRSVDVVPRARRRRPLPDRRHLVADRDRRHPHHAAPGHHLHQARCGHDAVSRRSAPTWSTTTAVRSATARAASWCSPSRGPACCGGSGAIEERYRETYWSRFPGRYFAGDGAKRDEDGDLWLLGPDRRRHEHLRAPDLDHRGRARAGRPPDGWPKRPWSGLPTRPPARPSWPSSRSRATCAESTRRRRGPGRQSCARRWPTTIGPIAKPRQILLTPELPKTRSGKIMRRLLRDVAEHRQLGDVTTLLDPVGRHVDRQGDARRGVRSRRLRWSTDGGEAEAGAITPAVGSRVTGRRGTRSGRATFRRGSVRRGLPGGAGTHDPVRR